MAKTKKPLFCRRYLTCNGNIYMRQEEEPEDDWLKLDNAINEFVDFVKQVRGEFPRCRAMLARHIEDCMDKIGRHLPEKEEE